MILHLTSDNIVTKQTPGRPKWQKKIRILTEFYFKAVWVFKMIHLHWYWISLWYSSGTTITYYIVKCECKSSVATFILISNCITMLSFQVTGKTKAWENKCYLVNSFNKRNLVHMKNTNFWSFFASSSPWLRSISS